MKINPEIKDQKFAMISRWEESGITQKQFTEQENVSMNNFQYWLKRYRKANAIDPLQGRKKSTKFIKLKTAAQNIFSGNVSAEIIFANGNRIKFYNTVEISELKQLAG